MNNKRKQEGPNDADLASNKLAWLYVFLSRVICAGKDIQKADS